MTAHPFPHGGMLPRRAWPIRVVPLGPGGDEDLSDSTTAEQRLAFVEALTREAWALTGWPVPDYDRAHLPVRLVRGSATPAEPGP